MTAAPVREPKTGGEIDSWCTKCKLDLAHRIIAMVGDKAKKVECKTCGSHHLYRAPKTGGAGEKKPAAAKKARASAAPRANSAAAKGELLKQWEKHIAGQPAAAFRTYRPADSFEPGNLIKHTKFGDGVVMRIVDRTKVEMLFADGVKTMAHVLT